eukprot:gene2772-10307_t
MASRSVEIPAVVNTVPKVYLAMAMEQLAEHSLEPGQIPPTVPGINRISLRTFNPDDYDCDRRSWAQVEVSAGEFSTAAAATIPARVAAAELAFHSEFGEHLAEMKERCFFAFEEESGRVVGTCTAWRGEVCGEERGRIHWVAVAQEWQGKGLSKLLLTAALGLLAERHSRAYLTSQTTSARAIKLYLRLGFVPLLSDAMLASICENSGKPVRTGEQDRSAWNLASADDPDFYGTPVAKDPYCGCINQRYEHYAPLPDHREPAATPDITDQTDEKLPCTEECTNAFIHCSKGASCILCAASITWGAGINNLFLAGCTRRCIPSQRMDDACPVKDKKYVPKFYTFILVGMFMNRGGN